MFVIGMLIGGMDLKKVLTNKKAYFISFMRLIVIPLIALLILKVSGLVGWNKEGEEILLIVFMAVISPVASTVTQMCQVYDNDSRYAGRCTPSLRYRLRSFIRIHLIYRSNPPLLPASEQARRSKRKERLITWIWVSF